MHAEVAGAGGLRTDRIEQRQMAVRAVDGVGAHRTGAPARVDLIGGVKVGSRGIKRQAARAGIVLSDFALGEHSGGGVHLEKINAPPASGTALRALGRAVGAHVGQNRFGRLCLRSGKKGARRQRRRTLQEATTRWLANRAVLVSQSIV
jgi:hypothetical protein